MLGLLPLFGGVDKTPANHFTRVKNIMYIYNITSPYFFDDIHRFQQPSWVTWIICVNTVSTWLTFISLGILAHLVRIVMYLGIWARLPINYCNGDSDNTWRHEGPGCCIFVGAQHMIIDYKRRGVTHFDHSRGRLQIPAE